MSLGLGVAGIILGLSVLSDLKTRKIPNALIVTGALVAVIVVFLSASWGGVMNAFLSFALAFACALPLYVLKAFGGGDFKLFLVVSLLLPWEGVLVVLFTSLIWGSLLGLFQVVMKRELTTFFENLKSILKRTPTSSLSLHKIPYSVALLFGYLTFLSLSSGGLV